MANTSGFNRPLDLITEREVVYDFVTRLMIGKDWTDPQYSNTIFDQNLHLKNILRQMAKSLPTSVYNNLQNLTTSYVEIESGDTTVTCDVRGKLLLAYSERTGQDLTDCFSQTGGVVAYNDENGNAQYRYTYVMTTDVPYTNNDIIRFYAVGNSII